MIKILIVDDEKNVLSSFKKILTKDGYETLTATYAEQGLAIAKNTPIDLLIMDIKMPGLSGLEAFSRFKEINPKAPIIIMTAYGTTETAIEAMQLGAYDYVIKPFEVPQMKLIIEKALEASRLMRIEVSYEPKEVFKGEKIIGSSLKMQQIYKIIGQVAATDVTVLLRGESGSGKEIIARAIYHHSHRKNRPFLVINSAAIPETLLESELFGYEKGAFTDARERRIGKLEQCNGGTIFLDEIGDMPFSIQTKILRVLEDRTFERLGSNKTITVDVRLITATNRNLEVLIKEGRFREDLYYRLNAVTVDIPALRERGEDIRLLVEYFIAKYNKELNKEIKTVSQDALGILEDYHWPGNVRELENTIKKAVLFCKDSIILTEHVLVKENIVFNDKDAKTKISELFTEIIKQEIKSRTGLLYKDIIEEIEKALIIEALNQTQGNQSRAAKVLGISRPTLKDRIERLGLRKAISCVEGQT